MLLSRKIDRILVKVSPHDREIFYAVHNYHCAKRLANYQSKNRGLTSHWLFHRFDELALYLSSKVFVRKCASA